MERVTIRPDGGANPEPRYFYSAVKSLTQKILLPGGFILEV